MSTIRPTAATPSLPNSPSTVHVATVKGAPSVLSHVAVGQVIEAKIISQTAANTYQVGTPMGKFLLHSTLNLPSGGTLILQLSSQTPFLQFQINSLNGKSPSLKTKNEDLSKTNTNQEKWHTSTKLAVGKILLATKLDHVPVSPKPHTQESKESPQSPISNIRISNEGGNKAIQKHDPTEGQVIKPSTLSKTKISNFLEDLRGFQGLQNKKNTTASNLKEPEYSLIGSKLHVKVIAIQQPVSTKTRTTPTLTSNKSTTTFSTGSDLKGVISGTTAEGEPIVQTKAGTFTLNTQTSIPPGSIISMEVTKAPINPISENIMMPLVHEGFLRTRKWPALEQSIQALEKVQESSTHRLINSIIPRPGNALISNVIFFLSALKTGDLNSWMGEKTLRVIERHQPNIAGRIKDDFSALSKMIEEPQSGDWRVALVPVNSSDGMHLIRILLRQNDEETLTGEISHNRFIIDVQLSRIGRMQLDGLVREEGNSLELIIRSDTHLTRKMQDDIRAIFRETTNESGIKGGINFQAAPANFIEIPDPKDTHNIGLVV